jgi:hypothetical protein
VVVEVEAITWVWTCTGMTWATDGVAIPIKTIAADIIAEEFFMVDQS